MHKLEMDATKLHTRGTYGQVEIGSCRVAGQARRGLEVRGIINSTHSVLYPMLGATSRLLFSSRCGSGWHLPAQLAGRTGIAAWREK